MENLGGLGVANRDIPVAPLIWLMIVAMPPRVDFNAIATVTRHRHISATVADHGVVLKQFYATERTNQFKSSPWFHYS